MKKSTVVSLVIVVVAFLAFVAWLHDFVSMGGGRVVYTAECVGGAWKGTTCTGHLVAGERYRFKALRAHDEVLYWTVGSRQPSGKLTDCEIDNAREWSCRKASEQPQAIAYAMKNGRLAPTSGKVPSHHTVEKWKWLLLRQGAEYLHDADT